MDLYFRYILLLTMLSCYFSYWWSVVGVFKLKSIRLDKFYTLLKLLSIVFWAGSIYIWSTKTPSMNLLIFGILTNIISLGLFWWAQNYIKSKTFSVVFGKDIPKTIETQGPYKYVRHPFYSCYLLCYFSTSLTLTSPLLTLVSLAIFAIYLIAIKIEETKFIQSVHITKFVEYRRKTGALIPRIKRQDQDRFKEAN